MANNDKHEKTIPVSVLLNPTTSDNQTLTLRATLGLLDSLFEWMNVPLCASNYSCINKRVCTVKVTYRQSCKGRITDLNIDSTGLKLLGEGE